MMSKHTRKLSKMPDEVCAEIGPFFADTPAIEEDERKPSKLDDNSAECIHTGLTPRWSDLDVNQHVNNVKYIGWILESSLLSILESQKLSSVILDHLCFTVPLCSCAEPITMLVDSLASINSPVSQQDFVHYTVLGLGRI